MNNFLRPFKENIKYSIIGPSLFTFLFFLNNIKNKEVNFFSILLLILFIIIWFQFPRKSIVTKKGIRFQQVFWPNSIVDEFPFRLMKEIQYIERNPMLHGSLLKSELKCKLRNGEWISINHTFEEQSLKALICYAEKYNIKLVVKRAFNDEVIKQKKE